MIRSLHGFNAMNCQSCPLYYYGDQHRIYRHLIERVRSQQQIISVIVLPISTWHVPDLIFPWENGSLTNFWCSIPARRVLHAHIPSDTATRKSNFAETIVQKNVM